MGAEGTALLSTAHVALVVNTARATAGIAVQRMVLVGAVGQVEEKNAVLQDARIANRDVVTTAKCVGIPTLTTFPVTARMQGLVQVEAEGPTVVSLAHINLDPPCVTHRVMERTG